MKGTAIILVGILLSAPLTANADLICKGKRPYGFTKFDVLRYCGEPLMKDSYLKSGRLARHKTSSDSGSRASTNDITWDEVQQWFYTVGFKKTSYTVEFEGGKVVRVIKGKNAP